MPARSTNVRLAVWVIATALTAWHASLYSFITDDAYITFVYARNLAEHGELTFNLGQPVEGYSNFLWAVLLAGAYKLGIPMVTAAKLLATVASAITLWVSGEIVYRALAKRAHAVAVFCSCQVMLMLAASASFACWTSGGLETQLFTCLVLVGVHFYAQATTDGRGLWKASVAWSFAAMTRPEGLLIFALAVVHRCYVNMMSKRTRLFKFSEIMGVMAFFGLWLPWFVWRWRYYGEPLPNTFYVKAGTGSLAYTIALRDQGLFYLWHWLQALSPFLLLPLAAAALAWRTSSDYARLARGLLFVIAIVYLLYAVRVGGDFMGLHRFVMPVTVALIIFASIGTAVLSRLTGGVAPLAALVLAIVVTALFAVWQGRVSTRARTVVTADRGIDTPAYLKQYAQDRAAIGKAMRPCFTKDDFSIFGGCGAKPFYARTEGVDVFGLLSRKIAHEEKPTRPRPGHNKWGPPHKMLKWYQPSLVFHCYQLHRQPTPPHRLCYEDSFWRRNGYEVVTVEIPGLSGGNRYYSFWARKDRRFSCAAD